MSALRIALLSSALGVAALGTSSCGPSYVQVSGEVAAPNMVMVSPGVWLVENYPYAIYYTDGFYWRYYDGIWYRSSFYDSGFLRVDVGIVPRVVVHTYRPHHVRYRPAAHAQRRPIVRTHRGRR